jgi:hypothetical protein
MKLYPKEGTQEYRVLRVLLDAKGAWINKQVFVREMYFTQAGRAIWNLENRWGWKGLIEHSDFYDEHGFVSYRITEPTEQLALL